MKNLIDILKYCPKGTKLYSPIYGEVTFKGISSIDNILCKATHRNGGTTIAAFTSLGKHQCDFPDSECMLFPSKDQRDWSKFTAPWYKKEKFDPKTLKPFDKVLARHKQTRKWFNDFYSFMYEGSIATIGNGYYDLVIPYNNDTKHLIGTTDEAPEYYRYWEE